MFTQVHNTLVWVNYELNIEEITDLFCENTDKPEMNCHGTCHLKKQIISSDTQNPVESNTQLYINEIELFSSSSTQEPIEVMEELVSHHSLLNNTYSYLIGNSLFHPPQA